MLHLFRVLARLPLPFMQRVGAVLGWLVWLVSTKYRRRLEENAQAAGFTPTQYRGAVANAGVMVAELPWMWVRSANQSVLPRVQWEGVAHFEAALALKKGVILITPHLGCWEVAAQAIAERFAPEHGAMSILFRPARKAAIAPLVASSRDRPGMKLFPTNSTGVRGLLRALRGGGIVGILPDQVPPQGQGVWVPFFGRPAYTMTLIARLAQQTGATVVMGWCERTPFAGRYTLRFERVDAPDLYDPKAAPEQSATAMNAAIESLVRQAPSQYLWSYARYKQPREEI